MFGSHFVTDEDNEMEWYHVRTEKSGIQFRCEGLRIRRAHIRQIQWTTVANVFTITEEREKLIDKERRK